MGIFNTVHTNWTDPATGRTRAIQVQLGCPYGPYGCVRVAGGTTQNDAPRATGFTQSLDTGSIDSHNTSESMASNAARRVGSPPVQPPLAKSTLGCVI